MVTCPSKQLGQQEACFARHTIPRHAGFPWLRFSTTRPRRSVSLSCRATVLAWETKAHTSPFYGAADKKDHGLAKSFCSDFRIFATRRASTCFGRKRISRHLRDAQTTPYLRILSLLSQPGQTSRQSLLARNKARKDIHLQRTLQTPAATPLSLSEGGWHRRCFCVGHRRNTWA